ncbi:MAG: ATP-dependent DNA helicase RecG [Chloroflexota bacterium]|nr:ATP-dependent DNA helicase RecG [Chloroflexota bacterium]MBI5703124.1 ATP-dependent DNA helicase RecG [Chloroflexota bacterium]
MQQSLENLRKFFRLERDNGYNNTAVIGGLAKMLDYWVGEARADGIQEEVIQAVVQRLRSYEGLSPQSRADVLKGLWKRIGDTYPEAQQKPRDANKAEGQPKPASSPSQPPVKQEPREQRLQGAPAPAAVKPRPPAAPRSETVVGAKTSATPAALDAKLTVLQGIGPKNAESLAKLGLYTLGDMLHYYPRRYDDYTQLKPIKNLFYGEQVTVIGTIQNVHLRTIRGGKASLVEVILSDGTGALRLSFFNQPWLANRFKPGDAFAVSGKVDQYLGRLVMNNPEHEAVDAESLNTNRIVPIYPLAERITQKWLRARMWDVVTYWAPAVPDPLPESVRRAAGLMPLGEALLQIHFPDTQEKLKAARERLAFDEIFYLQMGVLRQRRDWLSLEGRRFPVSDEWLDTLKTSLPFTLTSAQQRAIAEIRADLNSGKPMNRLLQGDVGSGKTVVAAAAATIVTSAGAQAAVMAPTSILAEQHYRNFSNLLKSFLQPGEIRLLVGDTPDAEKEEIRAGLADNSIKLVIGTHAVIEPNVQFADLQFVVIDEQHRFGVEQRAELRSKGTNPHLLVMTATPIPRSLALTIYGDLDLSVMDEMPAGRQPVHTYVLRPQERERAFTLIRSQIQDGRQAFIIYPLIEESEKINARAAVDDFETLSKEVFPDLRLGLLHGKMRPAEKDEVMLKFRDRQYDILVSTTVVEVGVDVPNATVMLIEGADRFGLAQLHQLRGRVGRGAAQSYCLLIPTREDATENERLQIMAESNDGFYLAEKDLHLRGPGEFLGTRQAGFASGLRMASITDLQLIEKARAQAQAVFEKDADLSLPEHALLAESLRRFWGEGKGDVS